MGRSPASWLASRRLFANGEHGARSGLRRTRERRSRAPIGAVRLSGGGRPQDSARAFLARYGSDLGSADLRDLGSFEESTGPDGTKRVQFGHVDGDNAKYNTREASVHLGDGNPRTQKHLPFALSFDVMVHEIGHGIVAHTSRLVYEREAGALNESFADVMSIAAKMWAPETRETATFRYAERSVNESVYGRPYLRDVLSPTPGFDGIWSYTQMEPCDSPDRKGNDACSVHAVAGIGNRAFAMMAVGGEETARTGTRIAVPSAIGYSAAAYVWYQSITTLANPRATYRDAALAQLKVAERIGPAARNAVGCAWAAVDVLSPVEQALWSLVCTSQTRVPKTGTCSDIGNGAMCHRSTAFAAVECRNGSTAAGQNCVSPRSRCVQVSPTDFRARLDTNGRAVCK